MLAELLSRERTPAEVLDAYGQLARLIGVHVVVWVEDLERFERTASRDGSRAAPISALLYQLQRIERLTVVLASDNLDARVDLQKIARFVESIPVIDSASAWPIISCFREGCLAMLAAKGEVDPASRKARTELSSQEDPALPMLIETFGATAILKGAIVHLCNTPRVLKQALRDALGVWENLRGEVDFDDVLLMCVVKAARPDIFAVVDDYVEFLRGPSEHRRDARRDDQAFKAALDTRVEGDADTKAAIDGDPGVRLPRKRAHFHFAPRQTPRFGDSDAARLLAALPDCSPPHARRVRSADIASHRRVERREFTGASRGPV